jgi:hypothetical protein
MMMLWFYALKTAAYPHILRSLCSMSPPMLAVLELMAPFLEPETLVNNQRGALETTSEKCDDESRDTFNTSCSVQESRARHTGMTQIRACGLGSVPS